MILSLSLNPDTWGYIVLPKCHGVPLLSTKRGKFMKPSKLYSLAGHWASCASVTAVVSINDVAEAGKVSCIYKGIKYDEKSVLIIRILIKNVKVLNINRVYCQCLALWDKKGLYRRSWFLSAPSWGGSSCTRWQCPAEADTSDRSGRKQTLEFSNQLFFSYKG